MKPENYDPKDYMPRGYYPFPDLINEHVDAMKVIEYHAIDTDFTHLSVANREKYKEQHLYEVTSRMQPYLSLQQLTPCVRFLCWHTIMDDQYEHCTIKELEHLRNRVTAILQGGEVLPEENGMFRQIAITRDELNAFAPKEWMDRFTKDYADFIWYGIGGEAPYRKSNTLPPLANYLVMREHSIGMYPHYSLPEIGLGFPFSGEVIMHPVILRIRMLADRVSIYENDMYSFLKEIHNEKENFNTIILLQKNYNMSLEEAVAECMRLHDADLAEMITLGDNLPDFGPNQENIKECIDRLGTVLQGILTYYSIYSRVSGRYVPEGFAWPDDKPVKVRVSM